ncbi:MAG: hypothetical protein Q8R02_14540 [Hyphomonadaceae bacterium]|nr:hypothetical protein [Hyphomonadaceae bacterium]
MLNLPQTLSLAAAATLLLAPLAAAQTPTPAAAQTPPQQPAPAPAPPPVYVPTSLTPDADTPRAPDGRPDLQGAIWATNFFPVFEASPLATKLVVSEAEAKKMVDTMVAGMASIPGFNIDPEAHDIIGGTDGLPLVRGERRSRLIVLPASGKLPISPETKKSIAGVDHMDGAKDDYEQRPSGERCLVLSGNPPIYAIIAYNRLRIVQTPTHIVIHSENGDEARIIPFATEHKAPGPRSWFGDSIAHWDGDTLVIETIRQNPNDRVRGLMTKFVVGEDAKVSERFTRVSKSELLYQFTIEDPKVYTAPWLGEFSFFTTSTGMFPSACHEHNYSLPNILQGARAIEAKTAGKTY